MKALTLASIESSREIQEWLCQFTKAEALVAKELLCNLEIISRDEYSEWLFITLKSFSEMECAVYAIRKFSKDESCLWDEHGNTLPRPAKALGSEDLVASVIANANKAFNKPFLDHPSLNELRSNKIRDILLVDDSIGSGQRVADFVKHMTSHPTFLSWWSYGWINFHIISYAQTKQSVNKIIQNITGSNHGRRKYRKSEKVFFKNEIQYDVTHLHTRWGEEYGEILNLCDSIEVIKFDRRRGFGNVMGNIVFHHSIPNNIPGILYSRNKGWKPLFPNRAMPEWLIILLSESKPHAMHLAVDPKHGSVPLEILQILRNIKSGIRTKAGLAKRMDKSEEMVSSILISCFNAGLISKITTLTPAGDQVLRQDINTRKNQLNLNYSLYLPSSWRTG